MKSRLHWPTLSEIAAISLPRIAGAAPPALDQRLGATDSTAIGGKVSHGIGFAVPIGRYVVIAGGRPAAGALAGQFVSDTQSNAYATLTGAPSSPTSGFAIDLGGSPITRALGTADLFSYGGSGAIGTLIAVAASFTGVSATVSPYGQAVNGGHGTAASVTSSIAVQAGDLALMWIVSDGGLDHVQPTNWHGVYSVGAGTSSYSLWYIVPTGRGVLSPSSDLGETANWAAAITAVPAAGAGTGASAGDVMWL